MVLLVQIVFPRGKDTGQALSINNLHNRNMVQTHNRRDSINNPIEMPIPPGAFGQINLPLLLNKAIDHLLSMDFRFKHRRVSQGEEQSMSSLVVQVIVSLDGTDMSLISDMVHHPRLHLLLSYHRHRKHQTHPRILMTTHIARHRSGYGMN